MCVSQIHLFLTKLYPLLSTKEYISCNLLLFDWSQLSCQCLKLYFVL